MHRSDQLSGMRRQYQAHSLLERQAPEAPLTLLHDWLEQALAQETDWARRAKADIQLRQAEPEQGETA